MSIALPTFSAEAIVRERIASLDTSASFLAALAGIPQSRLSLALNGTRSLGAEDGEKLKEITARLIDLREACGVFPLALHNAKAVRRLLDRMEERDITTSMVREKIVELFGDDGP